MYNSTLSQIISLGNAPFLFQNAAIEIPNWLGWSVLLVGAGIFYLAIKSIFRAHKGGA